MANDDLKEQIAAKRQQAARQVEELGLIETALLALGSSRSDEAIGDFRFQRFKHGYRDGSDRKYTISYKGEKILEAIRSQSLADFETYNTTVESFRLGSWVDAYQEVQVLLRDRQRNAAKAKREQEAMEERERLQAELGGFSPLD